MFEGWKKSSLCFPSSGRAICLLSYPRTLCSLCRGLTVCKEEATATPIPKEPGHSSRCRNVRAVKKAAYPYHTIPYHPSNAMLMFVKIAEEKRQWYRNPALPKGRAPSRKLRQPRKDTKKG